ncbi:uncharacterized protein LOC125037894 [Penaeus chinensis]|uniref:uncharacterized protein LOC125037894 n=1 Tax=Penaeus chinensis TaxID=139456 RepID=UPI001FB7D62B|nr:uncharacterized protein LOC125037894 [Penaeus chinensis]
MSVQNKTSPHSDSACSVLPPQVHLISRSEVIFIRLWESWRATDRCLSLPQGLPGQNIIFCGRCDLGPASCWIRGGRTNEAESGSCDSAGRDLRFPSKAMAGQLTCTLHTDGRCVFLLVAAVAFVVLVLVLVLVLQKPRRSAPSVSNRRWMWLPRFSFLELLNAAVTLVPRTGGRTISMMNGSSKDNSRQVSYLDFGWCSADGVVLEACFTY